MLTFDRLRIANLARRNEWHGDKVWDHKDWMVELMEELGEACGILKRMKRSEDGMSGGLKIGDVLDTTLLADELADVAIVLDLLAGQFDIDLGQAIIKKFNKTSDKHHLPVRMKEDGVLQYHGER